MNNQTMLITNKKKYYPYMLRTFLMLTAGFILVLLFTGISIAAIFLFLIVGIILISTKFTYAVKIDSVNIEVTYYTFLSERKLVIPRNQGRFERQKAASFRSSGYTVVNVFNGKKKIYSVDSRDGFNEEDLNKIIELNSAS